MDLADFQTGNLIQPQQDGREEATMLVLSRKLGEKIVINGNIVVTIVKIDRNQIRIGIEAPKDIPVYRNEIAPDHEAHGELVLNS
jgi:carbon storage regulator